MHSKCSVNASRKQVVLDLLEQTRVLLGGPKDCHGEHTPHGDRCRELSSRALGDMLSEQAPTEGAPTRRRVSGSKKDAVKDSPGAGPDGKRSDIVNFLHLALDCTAD